MHSLKTKFLGRQKTEGKDPKDPWILVMSGNRDTWIATFIWYNVPTYNVPTYNRTTYNIQHVTYNRYNIQLLQRKKYNVNRRYNVQRTTWVGWEKEKRLRKPVRDTQQGSVLIGRAWHSGFELDQVIQLQCFESEMLKQKCKIYVGRYVYGRGGGGSCLALSLLISASPFPPSIFTG